MSFHTPFSKPKYPIRNPRIQIPSLRKETTPLSLGTVTKQFFTNTIFTFPTFLEFLPILAGPRKIPFTIPIGTTTLFLHTPGPASTVSLLKKATSTVPSPEFAIRTDIIWISSQFINQTMVPIRFLIVFVSSSNTGLKNRKFWTSTSIFASDICNTLRFIFSLL